MKASTIAAAVAETVLRAIVMTAQPAALATCTHPDEKLTLVNGFTVHCACGEVFRGRCQHVTVEKVLPRVWRCVDCREWRGAGEGGPSN